MPLFLGLDIGTQGTKAVVIDGDRNAVIASGRSDYDLLPAAEPGAAEQHPQTWVDAVREVTAEVMQVPGVSPRSFAGVGVSGQQHGLVAVDERGEVVRPAKLWCDTSTAAEARELSEEFGQLVPTGFTASKVLWLARREPQNWSTVRQVLLPHDYINSVLTGSYSMEAGDASGTGFFDPLSREFDLERAAAIDPRLPQMLPPLTCPGSAAGQLNATGAELLGLPVGTTVAAGGGDNMMSAVGSGAVSEGVVVVSLGTSGTIFTHSDRPIVDPEGLIAPFCASVGGWLPLLCVMNLTAVAGEVAEGFEVGHAELTKRAQQVPVGCDGLLWLPFLSGERVPDLPDASGTLLGMRAGHLRPGVLYRAALEGTSLNLGAGLDRLRALGIDVDEVRAVGGAAGNPLWRQILADVFGCPVAATAQTESAALGAAIQALWTQRRIDGEDVSAAEVASPFVKLDGEPTQPDGPSHAAYQQLLERFNTAVQAVYRGGACSQTLHG